jgi:hypothetical protein
MKSSLWAISALVTVVYLVSAPNPSGAAWQAEGAVVCSAAREQLDPKIISDGTGGMIVAWTDDRNSTADVYAQRLDGSGNAMWVPDGIPIRAGAGGEFELVAMVTDGSDGAILVWMQDRNDIYAQHIDGTGTLQWSPAGETFPLSDPPYEIVAVADGAGGVIIAWVENRSAWDDIIAQRLDANGYEVWTPGGIYVFNPSLSVEESQPCIDADGAGGALIAAVSDVEIRVQRVYASGSLWSANGVIVTPAFPVAPGSPAINHDGTGGAYVVWHDGPSNSRDVFINWVDGGGSQPWGTEIPVCSASDDQLNPDVAHVENGNTVVCWEDRRFGFFEVYAQKVDAFGATLWTDGGMNVTNDTNDQFEPRLLYSGAPELVIAFRDTRGGERLGAQKIDAGGGTIWVSVNVDVLEGDLITRGYDIDSDGAGGLIGTVSYMDDIYAQAINARGAIYAAEPTIVAINDVPADQGGWVRITIGPSDRDTVGVTQEPCARYDVWREIDAVPAAAFKGTTASTAPIGVVFFDCRGTHYLEATSEAVVPEGSWELVGSFAASQDTQYVYLTPTPADSSDTGTPYATFFVSAHTTNPAVWFASEADSGYSVDNIPPHVPSGLTVAYNTGSGTQLDWDECPDDDFKYFRIYRSETPGFIPSPADYVHGTTDSEWLDTVSEGWRYYYKIAAVDMTDNESDPTSGTATGVEKSVVPDRVMLYQNVPNPFNPSTMISFTLVERARTTLSVYDSHGRLVTALIDETLDKGIKKVVWDGTNAQGNQVASGIYFYRLKTGTNALTRKMVLLK